MHVRMHIHDESRMEVQEMPQEWVFCNFCSGIKKGDNLKDLLQILEGHKNL